MLQAYNAQGMILAVFRNNDPNLINPRNRHLFGKLHQNKYFYLVPRGISGLAIFGVFCTVNLALNHQNLVFCPKCMIFTCFRK